jgi:hypothetical protein
MPYHRSSAHSATIELGDEVIYLSVEGRRSRNAGVDSIAEEVDHHRIDILVKLGVPQMAKGVEQPVNEDDRTCHRELLPTTTICDGGMCPLKDMDQS